MIADAKFNVVFVAEVKSITPLKVNISNMHWLLNNLALLPNCSMY